MPLPALRWGDLRVKLFLALLFTLLNGIKPLTIDDTLFHQYALQAAAHPFDPLGFSILWYQWTQPAITNIAPPVFPYWWSLVLHLSDEPFFWKLWLFPFAALFVFALHGLFRRFATTLEMPLLFLTVLSPVFLPSFNLMLDVPALALRLMALHVFFRAVDRSSLRGAIVAGLLAGLAAQTKYTGLLAPAIILLYGGLFRRMRLALIAASVAATLFVGWEMVILLKYGASHFLLQWHWVDGGLSEKARLLWPLMTILGGVLSPLILLGLVALGVRRTVVNSVGVVLLLCYLLIALLEVGVIMAMQFHFGSEDPMIKHLALPHILYGVLGLAVCIVTLLSAKGILRSSRREREWFLLLWLLIEVVGYFAITPFPAVRRVMGIAVAATMILGRLAAQACRSAPRRTLLRGVVVYGIVLGLFFYGMDLREAFAGKLAVARAASLIHLDRPTATVWYTGHWGFQFYAERAGMRPVETERSHLMAGDWVVMPDQRYEQQRVRMDTPALQAEAEVHVTDWLPLRTVMAFYSGDAPLEHHDGPRIAVTIYRVVQDFIPESMVVQRSGDPL